MVTEESCEVKTQRAILFSEMRPFMLRRVSHFCVVSPALYPADFNLAGPHMSLYSAPHMCIWCMLNINASWQDFFSPFFVSENVAKKMRNVHPLQNETFREWDYLYKPRASRIILACGNRGIIVHPLSYLVKLGLYSLFNWQSDQYLHCQLCWLSFHGLVLPQFKDQSG